MEIKELHSLEEMLDHFNIIQQLYSNITPEKYRNMLIKMLAKSYFQVAVFENGKCIAISGVWHATKLWCGDYIELDNIIVDTSYRSSGAGKMIFGYIEQKAKELNCTMLSLDSYTTNHKAHKFFYNQGFGPKGFHFVKVLNKEGIN